MQTHRLFPSNYYDVFRIKNSPASRNKTNTNNYFYDRFVESLISFIKMVERFIRRLSYYGKSAPGKTSVSRTKFVRIKTEI